MSELQALGWTDAWQSAFRQIDRGNLEPARVIEEQRGHFRVATAGGELRAGLTGRLRHEAQSRAELPAVGDWVAAFLRPEEGLATIHRILPRRSAIQRKVAGSTTESQVVAANVDTVFVVTSLNRDFNPRRIERYLGLVWDSGADPVVLLTKSDLVGDAGAFRAEAESVAMGVPVLVVSAHRAEGLEALAPFVAAARTTALIGSSGVGKSTLINTLAGAELQRVKQVRADDARGRHTTTARQLVRLPHGGLLIDTPGLREVALWDAEGVADAFRDVEELARGCRFRDCRHDGEPGCAIRAALGRGDLDRARYESYKKLQRELRWLQRRQDERAFLDEKRRVRRITASRVRERRRERS